MTFFLITPYLVHQTEALLNSFPRIFKTSGTQWKPGNRASPPIMQGRKGHGLWGRANNLRQSDTRISGTGYQQVKVLFFGLFDLVLSPILVFLILYYKEFFKTSSSGLFPSRSVIAFRSSKQD